MAREIPNVLALAAREAARPQAPRAEAEHGLGGQRRHGVRQARPDALRGLDRDLLAHDRTRERPECVAAALERNARMAADDPREDLVAPRERALRALPVLRAGRHDGCANGRLRSRFCGFIRTTFSSSIARAR